MTLKEFFKRRQRLKELREERQIAQYNRDLAKSVENIARNQHLMNLILAFIGMLKSEEDKN